MAPNDLTASTDPPVSPYSSTRNKQLVRVLKLIRLLQTGRRDLGTLTRELSVSSRTVRRDLAALEAAHLPVVKHGSDAGAVWGMR